VSSRKASKIKQNRDKLSEFTSAFPLAAVHKEYFIKSRMAFSNNNTSEPEKGSIEMISGG